MKPLIMFLLLIAPLVLQTQQLVAVKQDTSLDETFLRIVKSSSQPTMLLFDDDSSPILLSVNSLLLDDGVADLDLRIIHITSSMGGGSVALSLRRRFGLSDSVQWAVVDSKEQRLAMGTALPTAEGLVEQLAAKGVKSQNRKLIEFLKVRPSHIEARIDLLRSQERTAKRRTRQALDLEPSLFDRLPTGARIISSGANVPKGVNYQMVIGTSPAGTKHSTNSRFIGSRPNRIAIPEDTVLDALQDLLIWAGYASTIEHLFMGDDWIVGGLELDNDETPLEVCSPMLKALYSRKISQVEAALESAPGSPKLWSVWIRMAETIGDRSIIALTDRLAQLPGRDFSSWPPEARQKMLAEAREKNRWAFISDSLWRSDYEALDPAYYPSEMPYFAAKSDDPRFDAGAYTRGLQDAVYSEWWNATYEPLLEALIRLNDIGKADFLLNHIAHPQWGGASSIGKAIALANKCGRPDLAGRWSIYLPERQ